MRVWASTLFALITAIKIADAEPEAVQQIRRVFQEETAAIEKAYQTALTQCLAKYSESLSTVKEQYRQKGDLDGALATQTELDRFGKEQAVPQESPVNLPSLLRNAQDAYRQSVAVTDAARDARIMTLQTNYVKRLESLKQGFVRDEKLDDAIAADAEIKRVLSASKTPSEVPPISLDVPQPSTSTQAPPAVVVAPADTPIVKPPAPPKPTALGLRKTKARKYPSDALEFNGHHYKIVPQHGITWDDAGERCRKAGGYLLCIESEAEQDFIAGLLDKMPEFRVFDPFLIGGFRKDATSDWQWVNGAPLTFTRWHRNMGADGHGLSGPGEKLHKNHRLGIKPGVGKDLWLWEKYPHPWYAVQGIGELEPFASGYICEWDE